MVEALKLRPDKVRVEVLRDLSLEAMLGELQIDSDFSKCDKDVHRRVGIIATLCCGFVITPLMIMKSCLKVKLDGIPMHEIDVSSISGDGIAAKDFIEHMAKYHNSTQQPLGDVHRYSETRRQVYHAIAQPSPSDGPSSAPCQSDYLQQIPKTPKRTISL